MGSAKVILDNIKVKDHTICFYFKQNKNDDNGRWLGVNFDEILKIDSSDNSKLVDGKVVMDSYFAVHLNYFDFPLVLDKEYIAPVLDDGNLNIYHIRPHD